MEKFKFFNIPYKVIQDLNRFKDFFLFWNKRLNLVSEKDHKYLWERHIYNSMQFSIFIDEKKDKNILDIGSGSGFPAIVLAIIFNSSDKFFFLIEKDFKKVVFLRDAVKEFQLNTDIFCYRLPSAINIPKPDIITARAVSDLEKIGQLIKGISYPRTKMLFIKGDNLSFEKKCGYDTVHVHNLKNIQQGFMVECQIMDLKK